MGNKKELNVDVVDLEGSAYEIGLAQGQQATLNVEILKKMGSHIHAEKVKRMLTDIDPEFLHELRGLADGLNITYNQAIRVFSGYGVIFPAMGCTSLAQDGYYARNYDFSPDVYDARLVFSKPDKGYASVGFSQQTLGRLDGMNEMGLVIGLHFVNQYHHGEGFLATTIVRMVLDQCENAEQAMQLIKMVPQGYCFNYSITDKNGNRFIVEASPGKQFIRQLDVLHCTNHFQSNGLKEMNRENIAGSLKRLEFLEKLSKGSLNSMAVYKQFNDVASSLFFKDYKDFFGTLHTVIYVPRDLKVIAGVGGNCIPFEFSLKDWLAGKMELPLQIQGQIDH